MDLHNVPTPRYSHASCCVKYISTHHSHALVYFEGARAAYWRDVVGRPAEGAVDYVLADATVRWHRRVLWPDRLNVSVRVSLLGRKHFRMDYLVDSQEGDRLGPVNTI